MLSTSAFANSVHGILMVVKGEVEILQKDKLSKAKVGAKVFPGDTIITKKDARAKLVMVDKNIINISPDSKFLLEKYEYNPEENKKGALLNVIYGKVRTTVNQKYDGEQNKFQVKTKSSVAGVRGTDFLVSFNKVTNTSKVVTFEGRVDVGAGLDASGRITNPVSVRPGEFTVAAIGTPPSLPVAMPASEMASLNEQSVADTKEKGERPGPDGEKDKKERTPSNNEGDNGKRDPNSAMPPPPPAGSLMDQMGEDVAEPIVSDTTTILPPPIVPINTTPLAGTEALLPPPIDPSLTGGKSNVLINLQPSP